MDQPTAEQAFASSRLSSASGRSRRDGPTESRGRAVERSPRVARLGTHLLERGSAELPEAPDNISVIGCDAANGTYYQLYSDERGVCRVYEMSIGDGEWKLWREGEPSAADFDQTLEKSSVSPEAEVLDRRRPRLHQPRDRRDTHHQRQDGERPRLADPAQARRTEPTGSGSDRPPPRPPNGL